jgi:PAS domain S-box-containing protein
MKAPFLRNVLDGMPASIKIIDSRHRIVYANTTSRKNLGLDLNEMRGRNCYQVFNGFRDKCFFCNMTKVFGQGQPATTYCTFAVKGENRNFEVSIFPLAGPDPKIEYAVEVVRDITPLSKGGTLLQRAGKVSSRDKSFAQAFDHMAQWAEDDWPVLLQGEKGTGKKSFAQALHQRSRRSGGPFWVYHCVDNPAGEGLDGLFGEGGAWEKARGGTLYLEDLDRLGEASQKRLTEKLSEHADPNNPRVVAGTFEDTLSLVQREVLRLDLYNHFASRVLILPALRDRKLDLPLMAQHFIETYRVSTGSPAERLGPEALTQLMTYNWPGNIRELESQIERASLLAGGPVIEKLDLPVEAPKSERLGDLLGLTEKAYLVDTLAKTQGNLGETAKLAGLGQKTLQRKMKKYGLKAEDFRNLP